MAKYACKYCGNTTDDPNLSYSCRNAEIMTGVGKCFWVINQGPVQCQYCGTTFDSVEQLCHYSPCSGNPYRKHGEPNINSHIAAR